MAKEDIISLKLLIVNLKSGLIFFNHSIYFSNQSITFRTKKLHNSIFLKRCSIMQFEIKRV